MKKFLINHTQISVEVTSVFLWIVITDELSAISIDKTFAV